MFEKLKKFIKSLFEKSGVEVPDEKETDIDKAIEEFASELEGDNLSDEQIEKLTKKMADELGKVIKPEHAGGEDDERQDEAARKDEKIKKLLEPIIAQNAELKKELEDIKTKTAEAETTEQKKQVETILRSAFEAGKISRAQIPQYKEILEANFETGKKAIEVIPRNDVVARQNRNSMGFDIDAKAEGKAETGDDPAKRYTTSLARTVNPKILKYVEATENE